MQIEVLNATMDQRASGGPFPPGVAKELKVAPLKELDCKGQRPRDQRPMDRRTEGTHDLQIRGPTSKSSSAAEPKKNTVAITRVADADSN